MQRAKYRRDMSCFLQLLLGIAPTFHGTRDSLEPHSIENENKENDDLYVA